MLLDMNAIQSEYQANKGQREWGKWLFAVATFGLGGLYLWGTTIIIPEGMIGLRQSATGKMVLLPPGRHSIFPWESYPVAPQSLSERTIILGPYKIITVQTGFIAKTFKNGVLEILSEGQHLISDAAHIFNPRDGYISVKQETKKLHEVIASTSDNVSLIMHADVRYKIIDPARAIANIDDIETSIKEIAEISISQIVGHHSLADFSPATTAISFDPSEITHGIIEVIHELNKRVSEQLLQLGIQLINIGITSWNISDPLLAHELAQGAVVKSQAVSKLIAAKNAAEVRSIESVAESNAIVMLAQATAEASQLRGQALKQVAEALENSPHGTDWYGKSMDTELVSRASNVTLFFSQKSNDRREANEPRLVLTHPAS